MEEMSEEESHLVTAHRVTSDNDIRWMNSPFNQTRERGYNLLKLLRPRRVVYEAYFCVRVSEYSMN